MWHVHSFLHPTENAAYLTLNIATYLMRQVRVISFYLTYIPKLTYFTVVAHCKWCTNFSHYSYGQMSHLWYLRWRPVIQDFLSITKLWTYITDGFTCQLLIPMICKSLTRVWPTWPRVHQTFLLLVVLLSLFHLFSYFLFFSTGVLRGRELQLVANSKRVGFLLLGGPGRYLKVR